MKRLMLGLCLPLVALAVLTSCGTSGAVNAQAGNSPFTTVDVDRFQELSHQPGAVILDVRTPDEFAQGHIAGAVNLDYEAPGFTQKVATLDKNATYLVQCRTGKRSARACDQMSTLGFTHLYSLQGGITAWSAAGKLVEK